MAQFLVWTAGIGVAIVAAGALVDNELFVAANARGLVVWLVAAAFLVVGWSVDDDARAAHLGEFVVREDTAARVVGIVLAACRWRWIATAALEILVIDFSSHARKK